MVGNLLATSALRAKFFARFLCKLFCRCIAALKATIFEISPNRTLEIRKGSPARLEWRNVAFILQLLQRNLNEQISVHRTRPTVR